MSSNALKGELQQAGAKSSELDGLIEVASQLDRLKSPAPARPGRAFWRRWQWVPLGSAAVIGILLGAAVVTYAQTSSPGGWLYSVKRVSEKVAVAVDPNYRATLMMRRSQEVEELVGHRASQHTVLATLADYRTEAAAYKTANYAAFEYCKSNLEQAAGQAPAPERAAITSTLASIQT